MFRLSRPAQISTRWWMLALLLTVALQAQGRSREDCERQFKPHSGQPGKDVIWVPTGDQLVTRMLQMAAVTSQDTVYDLGAGDGKIAIAAAKQFGAKAVGVEYDPHMARLARCYAEAEGVADRVRIIQGDIFETDFSRASVITLYLLPELNLRLRPKLLRMKPGTRVVSHSFMMQDWEPDQSSSSEDGHAYLWIVPADVAGTWKFRSRDGDDAFTVELQQQFQQIQGTAGKRGQPLTRAKLNGTLVDLAFSDGEGLTTIAGRVNGDRIDANVTRDDTTVRYTGTRL